VVTTVWVGVFVISFFNLRFGWTYSGLVVPGYLVPLILTNPVSAVVTIAEGIMAYALVRFVSEYLSRFGWWCNFFGRDRFFALFISAVLVRVVMDGWCLPLFSSWLQLQWNLTFDYKGTLHSFGMIIIALIANQFWKTGLWRGLVPFGVTLGITFIIVRFVLMTVTNFNVAHLAYMYSNTAASLLASPKSYIILVVTGFVASRMNLRYGWEYNGILIPALLALQWYEPLKILSSFCEAAVVYIVSDLLLQSRLFRGVTMEGARKLLLFFNVAYAYRFVLGHVLPVISPGMVVNDYYGFAYLLSSLIALKMHSKHIVLRLARATLQTSFVAAVAANLLGLWLASVVGSLSLANSHQETNLAALKTSAEGLEMTAVREKVRLYRKRKAESVQMPTPGDLNRFQEALSLIQKHLETGTDEPLLQARKYLRELRFGVELVEGEHLCLCEQEPTRGWGFYVIDLKRPNGLAIEVPAPLEEYSAMESAVCLYRVLDGATLAVAGGGRFTSKDGSSDVLANPHTPFEIFHRVFGRRNVLQVRGYTEQALQRLPTVAENCLYVKRELPRSLSLKRLEKKIGRFQVVWKPAPLANAQEQRTRTGFAELWLARTTRIQLKADLADALPPLPALFDNVSSDPNLAPAPTLEAPTLGSGFTFHASRSTSHVSHSIAPLTHDLLVLEWLLNQKRSIAKAGSNTYIPPLPEEMLFFDEEILTPLLEIVHTGYRSAGFSSQRPATSSRGSAGLTAQGTRLLNAINVSASLFNYQAAFCHDPSLDENFLILAELSAPSSLATQPSTVNPQPSTVPAPRHWGTLVLRLGERRPYAVQVPRPLFDLNSLECGVHLFERLRAESLLLAGSHHQANQDDASDVLDFRNTANFFSLVNQVVMREAHDQPRMAIQCRGCAGTPGSTQPPEVLVAFQDGIRSEPMLTSLGNTLVNTLKDDGLRLQFVDGSPGSAGYEISCVPQAQYLAESTQKEFAILWLSPTLREVFRPQDENYPLQVQLKALDIPVMVDDLPTRLSTRLNSNHKTVIPAELKRVLNHYVATRDIVSLQQAKSRWPNFQLAGLLDRNSRQLVLLISDGPGCLPAVLNLQPRANGTQPQRSAGFSLQNEERIALFLASRSPWLEWTL